jgi:hypothetical protein
MQLGLNGLTAFRTNGDHNRARKPYAPCPLGWIGLGKIGHGCELCHPTPELSRLPRGVTGGVAAVSRIFGQNSRLAVDMSRAARGPNGNHPLGTGVTLGRPLGVVNSDYTSNPDLVRKPCGFGAAFVLYFGFIGQELMGIRDNPFLAQAQ